MIGAQTPRDRAAARSLRDLACLGFARFGGQLAIFATVSLLVGACAQPIAGVRHGGMGDGFTKIFVVNYGWHSGIAVSTSDISERVLPEVRDFPGARFLEVGWGDWDYYQAAEPGFGLLLKAAFWPTRSVLYLVGITGSINDVGYDEIVELMVDDQMLHRIMQFISDTFLRAVPTTTAQPLPGHHPASGFYPARGRFHVLRNCNTWVGEALSFGGMPINTAFIFTARGLMSRVRPFEAKTLQNRDGLKSEAAGISIRRDSIERAITRQ